uniref:Uncharacterized protein n=1 Tax=Arundo donax TaxID=35708 RepID=A0A0A9D5B3_ARUDO
MSRLSNHEIAFNGGARNFTPTRTSCISSQQASRQTKTSWDLHSYERQIKTTMFITFTKKKKKERKSSTRHEAQSRINLMTQRGNQEQ